jgi:hypothetical protein
MIPIVGIIVILAKIIILLMGVTGKILPSLRLLIDHQICIVSYLFVAGMKGNKQLYA